MVKNVKGGKHKGQARKHLTSNDKKLRLKEDDLELYACVLTKLGGNKLEVFCMDGVKRLCTIPGKFSNRRRDNMIEKGSFILVGLRDWETAKERENCDLLETYNENERVKLTNTVNENWDLFLSKEKGEKNENDGFHFTNDHEEQQARVAAEIIQNTRSVTMDEDINIDDI